MEVLYETNIIEFGLLVQTDAGSSLIVKFYAFVIIRFRLSEATWCMIWFLKSILF